MPCPVFAIYLSSLRGGWRRFAACMLRTVYNIKAPTRRPQLPARIVCKSNASHCKPQASQYSLFCCAIELSPKRCKPYKSRVCGLPVSWAFDKTRSTSPFLRSYPPFEIRGNLRAIASRFRAEVCAAICTPPAPVQLPPALFFACKGQFALHACFMPMRKAYNQPGAVKLRFCRSASRADSV